MSSRVRRSSLGALVVVFALLALPSASWAQQQPPPAQAVSSGDPEQGFGIGAKFGPLFAKFDSSLPTVKFEKRTGFQGGLFFGGNRPGLVGVMAEINYAKRSTKKNGNEQDYYSLEVPVLLRINAGSENINKWNVYGVIGPAVNLNLKAQQKGVDIKKNVQTAELEIVGGVGVEITRFIIEGRMMKGLRNIGKDLSLNEEIKTQSFALLFGVRFN